MCICLEFRWSQVRSSGPAKHSFVENGHEIISTAILSLLLIQVGQLSVTGERICTKYRLTTLRSKPAKEECGYVTDRAREILKTESVQPMTSLPN